MRVNKIFPPLQVREIQIFLPLQGGGQEGDGGRLPAFSSLSKREAGRDFRELLRTVRLIRCFDIRISVIQDGEVFQ